ncbi:MAG: heavy metal-associated domain-containing protein [Flavobacteriales bacterium]|nr:heavy metal-associated domain-containing protein [Flavobacteriales bacterium]
MKKFVLFFAFAAALASTSCNESSSGSVQSEVPTTRKSIQSEVNKTVANLTISGMTCAEGCGGKIQQDLQALNGIRETKLDYADERLQNIVTVTFDPSLISEKEMIGCVNAIADGAYKVESIEIIEYKGLQSSSTGSIESSMSGTDFGRVYQVFNLLQMVTKLAQ